MTLTSRSSLDRTRSAPGTSPGRDVRGLRLCVCGHRRHAHEHHRGGTDCATCDPWTCRRFRRATWLRRLLRLRGAY